MTEARVVGRELDAEVASRVFGVDTSRLVNLPVPCPDGNPGCCVLHLDRHFPSGVRLPHYSSDMKAAWEVFLKLPQQREHLGYRENIGLLRCYSGWAVFYETQDRGNCTVAEEPTPELAICLAALALLPKQA